MGAHHGSGEKSDGAKNYLSVNGLSGGAEGDRTLDLRIANATLSQLSYRPMTRAAILASANGRVQWSFGVCHWLTAPTRAAS
jgi:hypothetical protein